MTRKSMEVRDAKQWEVINSAGLCQGWAEDALMTCTAKQRAIL